VFVGGLDIFVVVGCVWFGEMDCSMRGVVRWMICDGDVRVFRCLD
jgi:hypothetical protein